MVALWTRDFAQLHQFGKCIKDFVWSGQYVGKFPRVNYDTITRPKDEGRLGLISVEAHFIAMVGKTILWAAATGNHTLQWIIQAKLGELSERRWDTNDFTWLIS